MPDPSMHCYRFPDQDTATAAFEEAGLLYVDPDTGAQLPITASHDHALDVIGLIYEGGTYDAEGEVIEPPTLLDGWHVNYIGQPPAGWEPYAVTPANPVRIFAGMN